MNTIKVLLLGVHIANAKDIDEAENTLFYMNVYLTKAGLRLFNKITKELMDSKIWSNNILSIDPYEGMVKIEFDADLTQSQEINRKQLANWLQEE